MWWTPRVGEPRWILAIDPSLSCTGWALGVDGGLLRCGVVPTRAGAPTNERMVAAAAALSRYEPDLVVVEWPQIYQHGRAKKGARVDPNDMLLIAGVVGALLHALDAPAVLAPRPANWKGQVPKAIHNARVLAGMSPGELDVLRAAGIPKAQANNAIDAIGLLKWAQKETRHVGDLDAANEDQDPSARDGRVPRSASSSRG